MRPDDPSTALRDIADHLPGMRTEVTDLHKAVKKSRRWIAVVAVVAVVAVGWTARQQAVVDGQQATLDAKSAVIDRLAHQNAVDAARDARNAHVLCVKLNRSRAVIEGAWREVQFRPGVSRSAVLAKVEAAEPLGACPKPPPAGS